MTTTYADVMSVFNIPVPKHLKDEIEVPVLSENQRQGDIYVLHCDYYEPVARREYGFEPLPAEGVQVVTSEDTGNTHFLHPNFCEGVMYRRTSEGRANNVIMKVFVPEGCSINLVHTEEHGVNSFGPGFYEIRRQIQTTRTDHLVVD